MDTENGVFLPCLFSNNCNGVSSEQLSGQHKKSAVALAWNVQALADKYGLEHLGFLTLTFRDHVLDGREAQRRFKSLRTGILNHRYSAWLRVLERQKSGRIHYHLLVALDQDIRTGFDFSAIEKHDYRSASADLRAEWAFWRKTAPRYGFGRTELLPVRSSSEAIARYVGKYISKHLGARKAEDKGLRLVEYSSAGRTASTRFQWHTSGSAKWRSKVQFFAYLTAQNHGVPATLGGIRCAHGPRWAYKWRDFILSLPVE